MNTIAIATVDACKPAPFTARPFLALVTADQVGTPARHVRHFDAGTSVDELDAEARALEMTGVIDADVLAADWTLDQEALDQEAAQIAGDREAAFFDDEGMAAPEVDLVEEIEPLA